MALRKITVQPGVNQQLTQTANSSSWWASNLVRFRDGTVERLAGWQRLFDTQLSGLARTLWGYEDLQNTLDLGIGTDAGLQIYSGSTLYNTVASFSTNITALNFISGGGTGSVTTTSGSAVATVYDANYSPKIGQTVTFPMNAQMGFVLILAGTSVTVTGVNSSAHTWTFNLPANALFSGSLGPYPLNYTTLGTTKIRVQTGYPVPNFTAVVGNTFTVGFNVVPQVSGQSINVPAGTYTISSVNQAGSPSLYADFVIETNIAQGSTGVQGQEYSINYIYPVVYATSSIPSNVSNWYIDNQGQVMMIVYTNGPLLAWTPPASTPPLITAIVNQAPGLNAGMMVAMPQQQVILWGTEPVIGTAQTDPLLIRFSDAGSYTIWTASATNQAGSYRLSRGSKIVGGIQLALVTLIWTDTDLWSMQYVGTPLVYSFNILATGCGLISPKARAILGGTCYWMTNKQFWSMSAGGGGSRPIYCPVWDIIFNDLDQNNLNKIHAGSNSAYGEVYFFYPSESGGTGEIDKYVKLTQMPNGSVIWDYGNLARTCWMDQSVFGNAMGADLNLRIQQHDIGYDDDGSPMTGAFIESGYADINDGDAIEAVTQVVPDLKWFGSTPGGIQLTLKGVNYPQEPATTVGPYGLDMQNAFVRPRIRARSIAMRWDWIARIGYNARIGAVRIRSAFAGRKP